MGTVNILAFIFLTVRSSRHSVGSYVVAFKVLNLFFFFHIGCFIRLFLDVGSVL